MFNGLKSKEKQTFLFCFSKFRTGTRRERPEQMLTGYLLHAQHVLGKIRKYKTSFLPHYELTRGGNYFPFMPPGQETQRGSALCPRTRSW